MRRAAGLLLCALACFASAVRAWAQLDVGAQIDLRLPAGKGKRHAMGERQVVVWLTPPAPVPVVPGHFELAQKDKMFHPHLLVLPVGSTVSFPNRDPYFHNVFSLFNGKRFDLGLYEAGGKRDVVFNHEGVSYIFCNIHPEMSAVVLALATPYYAVSDKDARVTLPGVPAGTYLLNVWAEGVSPHQLEGLSRTVDIGPSHTGLGTITLLLDAKPEEHTDKFGKQYTPPATSPY